MRAASRGSWVRPGRLLPGLVLAGAVLGGCSQDPQEAYCEVVAEEQDALAAAAEQPGGLLEARDSLGRLAGAAPRDVRDEWAEVLLRVDALRAALDEAGVDPASYDPGRAPEGVGAEDRRAIESAAVALVEPTTQRAVRALEQQTLDVCRTSLGL